MRFVYADDAEKTSKYRNMPGQKTHDLFWIRIIRAIRVSWIGVKMKFQSPKGLIDDKGAGENAFDFDNGEKIAHRNRSAIRVAEDPNSPLA